MSGEARNLLFDEDELFDLQLVAINTAFLLLSSITFGFAMLQKQEGKVSLDASGAETLKPSPAAACG